MKSSEPSPTPRRAAPSVSTAPPQAWHTKTSEQVLQQLQSSITGLSSTEAAQRLLSNGPNELKEGKRISAWQIFLGQFKSLIV